MSYYGEERERHRQLQATMSRKQADEQIHRERERRNHELMLKAIRESGKVSTPHTRKSKDTTSQYSSKQDKISSSNDGGFFVGAVIVAVLVGVFNSSSDDKATAPVPVTSAEAKEVVLNISSPLSGTFVCALEGGKYATTFTATGPNKMAVSQIDPSLKGRPAIGLGMIDIYATSCKHAEKLINDYYRVYRHK